MQDKILYVISKICQTGNSGKKKVQKLLYLIERKGFDLGLEYKLHFYGPYCSDLNQLIHNYEAANLLTIEESGSSHLISVDKKFNANPLSERERNIVNEILERYGMRTPIELEVLTTTDFVASNLIGSVENSDKHTLEGVKKIKGNKFTEKQIIDCIQDVNIHLQ